jgi:hypothetical protein
MNYLRDYDLGKLLKLLRTEGFTTKRIAKDLQIPYDTLCNSYRKSKTKQPSYAMVRSVVNYATNLIDLDDINNCIKGETDGDERLTQAD